MTYRGNVARQYDDGGQTEVKGLASVEAQSTSEMREIHPLDEMLNRKPIRKHVQEFALVFGIIMLGVAAYFAYKQRPISDVISFMLGAAALVLVGYRAPMLLKPVWEAWMKFAEGLGKVMTFLLLSIMWVGMFIPLAFLLRLFGKEVMNMRFREPELSTYWESRDNSLSDFKLVERQY